MSSIKAFEVSSRENSLMRYRVLMTKFAQFILACDFFVKPEFELLLSIFSFKVLLSSSFHLHVDDTRQCSSDSVVLDPTLSLLGLFGPLSCLGETCVIGGDLTDAAIQDTVP